MPDSGTPPTPPNADQTKQPSASDAAIEAAAQRLTRRQIIKDAAEYVKKHISRQPPVQRFFSFMPTMLTRVSPFHFKARTKYKEWPLVRLDSGDANSWGRMQVVGELLVIFDETILFGLLALMTKYQSDAFETTQEELCRLADVQPTPTNYGAIWKSIQRLAGTRIDLELFSGKGRKRKDLKEMTGSILSYADIDKGPGSIRVVINPYFLEMYAASFVTNIDLKFRARLKSDVSKAFYRFYQGQYEGESEIDILRLARAVNLDTDLEIRRLKDKVRTGLKELEQKGYLASYQITKENRVIISKSKDSAAHIQSQILDLENL
jgi:hypothetical protein